MIIMIAGCAGFIGSHVVDRLLGSGKSVVGIDNFDPFYDPSIKMKNIQHNINDHNFIFLEADIREKGELERVFTKNNVDYIIHLAARAGVMPTIQNMLLYKNVDENIKGTINPLEFCKEDRLKNFELSVIIPAYNEKEKILTTIKHVRELFNDLGIGHEIIVVDDGSIDRTFEEAKSEKFANVKVVGYKQNMGKGYAIKYGTKFVTKDVVTFLDADMELDPKQISILMEYMKIYNADIVVGSKRHSLSKIKYYPLARRILSRMYNIVLRALLQLNLRDTQAGFKLIKRETVQKIFPHMRVKRYAFDVEFLAYANRYNYKIVEAPIILKFTRKGWGRINFKTILNIFLDTIAVASRFGVLQYYTRIFRDSAIMITAFVGGMSLYKQFVNPFVLPGIETRGLTAIFVLGLILIVVTLPYESIARKFEK